MSILFQETSLGNMTLQNRFVRSATWEGLADPEGLATPELDAFLARLARGRVGLIVTGHAYVCRAGKAAPRQLGVDLDDKLPGLRKLAGAVHAEGGAVCLQLAHGGAFTRGGVAAQGTLDEPMGPSVIEDGQGNPLNREMTLEDIGITVRAFGRAAKRAKEAGFDAVQIHASHGYLLSQFLSPVFNKRGDGYGGDGHDGITGRARLLNEVVEAVRLAVGPDYPVLVKLNSQDYAEGGMTLDESLLVARRLENQGVDAVEFSGGLLTSKTASPVRMGDFKDPDKQAWYREAGKRFKEERAIPLILVGGIRDFSLAEELVANGYCDYVALSRPLIREPDLIKRWQSGDVTPSACASDNLCFKPGMAGQGIHCVRLEREHRKE